MSISPYLLFEPLLSAEQILQAGDDELIATIQVLAGEQVRRALSSGDPTTIADTAFDGTGFDFRGNPVVPYLHQQLLVCPGVKVEKSKTSHDCVFVSIGDEWAWECPDAVHDEMRQLPGAKVVRRSITIIPVYEGLTYDVVTSQGRGGARCQMKSVRSFEVRGGALVETRARTRAETSHR